MILTWTFTSKAGEEVPIYTGNAQSVKVTDPYKGRVQFNTTTNTLVLNALTATDSGTYTLSIFSPQMDTHLAKTELLVLGMFHLIVHFR